MKRAQHSKTFSTAHLNIKWPHAFLKVNKKSGSKKCQTGDTQNELHSEETNDEAISAASFSTSGHLAQGRVWGANPCAHNGLACLCAAGEGPWASEWVYVLCPCENRFDAAAASGSRGLVLIWVRAEAPGALVFQPLALPLMSTLPCRSHSATIASCTPSGEGPTRK